MPSPAAAQHRRTAILAMTASQPYTKVALLRELRNPPRSRTLDDDLKFLRRAYPGRFISEPVGKALQFRFLGEPHCVLSTPLSALDEDQVAAIIAARGLLRLPDPNKPAAEDNGDSYHGALAQALDRLLRDTGLGEEARAIAPDAVAISRFGVAPEEDAAFPAALAAIRTGEALRFTYTNLEGATHAVHAQPVRLVHICGEWHLLAWAVDQRRPPGRLKQYRLSRLREPQRAAQAPPHCPASGLRAEASAMLRDAFRATGSLRPDARRTVDLVASPRAWPFLEGRRWGAGQRVDPASPAFPPAWRRLRFTTTGLEECRHWLLSFGAEIHVLAPDSLITWLRDQAQALARLYTQTNSAAGFAEQAGRVPT